MAHYLVTAKPKSDLMEELLGNLRDKAGFTDCVETS
jgi:hypothetical protein